MEREYINSTMISSIGYDYDSAILEVEFKSNHHVWNYYDVPSYVYDQFRIAESLGKYFHSNIKNTYREARVG
ncbi:KTSC domain-containing protein [Paenibacillus sp. FSL H7-0690]|uniref:KTSC domain-containing protein n=1 Tax=Paenibacillus sp. FSL H7-0690 TaxID=2921437 RepID=UPI0030EE94F9